MLSQIAQFFHKNLFGLSRGRGMRAQPQTVLHIDFLTTHIRGFLQTCQQWGWQPTTYANNAAALIHGKRVRHVFTLFIPIGNVIRPVYHLSIFLPLNILNIKALAL